MKISILCATLCFAALPAPAFAADDCADPQDQTTLNICADKDLKAADGQLNAKYKEIQKRLAEDSSMQKQFTAAQRSWIAYRDSECAFQSSGTVGGSIHPMIYAQCITGFTNARIADFNRYLSCEEGDLSCPVPAPN